MILSVKNIELNFSYKSVLKNVSVQFGEGQIHAVLGENGAGKSTLAKIISGELIPSKGTVLTDDKIIFPAKNFNVKTSLSNGICYVHQRPLLAENASIYENIILGLKNIDKKQIERLMKIWMPDHSERTLVKDIGGDCNFFTALICALLKKPEILILDEPCALLDETQTEFLYTNLRKLADEGKNIIVITHSKKEAANYCDTVTILDNGTVVYNGTSDFEKWNEKIFLEDKGCLSPEKNYRGLSPLQTLGGLSPSESFEKTKWGQTPTQFSLTFSNLNCKPVNKPGISSVSFTANASEITLISGLPEDGIETLENVICGMETSKLSGLLQIEKNNFKYQRNFKYKKFNSHILRNKTGNTVAIIPSDKTFRASNPDLTIKQLLSFSPLSAEELIKRARINIHPKEKAICLSGGMLQRLILQRELSLNPDILILCSPLQGLDFASSDEICNTLLQQSKLGKIVLILSASEFPENLCNKRYKLKAGKIYQQEGN